MLPILPHAASRPLLGKKKKEKKEGRKEGRKRKGEKKGT